MRYPFKKEKKPKHRKVTPSILGKTCGTDCKVVPPEPYQTWSDYLATNRDQPKPYRSWLEFRLFADGPMKDVDYEPIKVDYEVIEQRSIHLMGLWVTYGLRLRVGSEHGMRWISTYMYVDQTQWQLLVFVLHSEKLALPGAQKRKDGTRRCMEDWLEENDFAYTYESKMQHFMDNFNKGIT